MKLFRFAIATVPVAVVLCGCGNEAGLSRELASLREEVARQQKMLSSLGADAEFNRDAAEEKLARLERQFQNPELWPMNSGTVEELRKELKRTVESASPLQQEAWLPRTLPLSWNVEVALELARFREVGDDEPDAEPLQEIAERLELLSSARPTGGSEVLALELDGSLETVASRLTEQRTQSALDQATMSLASSSRDELDAAWLLLDSLDDPSEKILALKEELRAAAFRSEVDEQRRHLQSRLDRLRSVPDPELQQAGFVRLNEAALTLKLDLLFQEQDTPFSPKDDIWKQIDDLIADSRGEILKLAQRTQESRQKQVQKYQKWALEQIQKFNARSYAATKRETEQVFASFESPTENRQWALIEEFDAVAEFLSQKTGVRIVIANPKRSLLTPAQQQSIYDATWSSFSWKHLDDIAYLTSREAAIRYLLPIESSLLEPPVRQLYSKAFEEAWTDAESNGNQLKIAQQTVTTQKKLPSDF